jgi:hypothetical protein
LPSSFKNQTINNNKENTMKKTLLALLSIAIAFTALAPAQAQDQKVLAILDTAINSKNFSSIIHEVCFTTVKNMACPNGQQFMEGPGAASAPWPTTGQTWLNNGTYHGDQMVKAALVTNPNIKIVFIRIHNVTSLGNSSTPSNGETILKGLEWVTANASKYSIDAVSVSQSGIHTDLKTKAKSPHPGCRDSSGAFTNQVSQLNMINVPTFIATGNDKQTFVGFPACIPGVIGVGALGNETQLEGVTNTGPGLDMVAPGLVKITKYNGSELKTAGSSVATVVSAASYVNRNTFKTFGEYLASLPKILIGTASYIRN